MSGGIVVWGYADVLVPEFGLLLDELLHEGGAAGIVEDAELDGVRPEDVLGTHEGAVLADDDSGDTVEEECSGAHDARAQGCGDGEGVPIPSPASGPDTGDFRVSGGITGLDAEVVCGSDDAEVW